MRFLIDVDKDWAPTGADWQEQDCGGGTRTRLWNKGGVLWADAPKPRRWHRCQPQTYGLMDWFTVVHRCACGAMSFGDVWINRNSRR